MANLFQLFKKKKQIKRNNLQDNEEKQNRQIGVCLLAISSKRHSQYPIIVYTNYCTKEQIESIKKLEAEGLIPKVNYLKKRTINEEQLENYFTFKFKSGEDSSFNTLVKILEDEYGDDKTYAYLAYRIFESKYFIKGNHKTFSSWYKTFCEIIGCDYNCNYKPSKLKNLRGDSLLILDI